MEKWHNLLFDIQYILTQIDVHAMQFTTCDWILRLGLSKKSVLRCLKIKFNVILQQCHYQQCCYKLSQWGLPLLQLIQLDTTPSHTAPPVTISRTHED